MCCALLDMDWLTKAGLLGGRVGEKPDRHRGIPEQRAAYGVPQSWMALICPSSLSSFLRPRIWVFLPPLDYLSDLPHMNTTGPCSQSR